jgi:vacuolar-type H+-ATPase subunit H
MAKEMVQAVRQAELKAAQMERDSAAKREAILNEAQQNAKTLITSMTKEASAKAAKELKSARLKEAETLESARIKAENEVILIREMMKGKEQAVIDLVLSEII